MLTADEAGALVDMARAVYGGTNFCTFCNKLLARDDKHDDECPIAILESVTAEVTDKIRGYWERYKATMLELIRDGPIPSYTAGKLMVTAGRDATGAMSDDYAYELLAAWADILREVVNDHDNDTP